MSKQRRARALRSVRLSTAFHSVNLCPGMEQAVKVDWEGNKFLQLPHYSSLPPAYWGHMPFLPSSWGMHAITIVSLKDRPTKGTVLTSRWFISFRRSSFGPQGVKPLKIGRAKTYSRPLASKSGGAFALPDALYSLFHPCLCQKSSAEMSSFL